MDDLPHFALPGRIFDIIKLRLGGMELVSFFLFNEGFQIRINPMIKQEKAVNAKWLLNLKGVNYWYLASAVALNLFWTMGVGLAVTAFFLGQAQRDPGTTQLILLAASFIGPLVIGWMIGQMAADGRGPTYGFYGSFGSVGVLLATALSGGIVGLMMIVAAVAGGLNGGMAAIRRR